MIINKWCPPGLSDRPNEIDKMIEKSWLIPTDCVLCDVLADMRSIFIPDDAVLFGGQEGKKRVVIFGICSQCIRHEDREVRVEEKLMKQLKAR